MPVTLPRVERTAPVQPTPVMGLEVNPPSIAEATQSSFSAIGKTLNSVTETMSEQQKLIEKEQRTQIDLKSTELSNQFENWAKERRAQIALKTGDTTADWAAYDDDADAKQTEIMEQYKDVDPRFQTLIENKLRNTYGAQETFRNIQQNEQNFKWRRTVIDEKVKLSADNFFEATRHLDATKPETFALADSYIQEMIASRIAEGDQIGTLTLHEDGTPDHMSGPVGVEIRKNVGPVVIDAVKTLNASGKVNEGKELIERYAPFMNANDRAKLLSDNDEANVKNQALQAVADLRAVLGRTPTMKEIDQYMPDGKTPLSEAVQAVARNVVDVDTRLEENEKKRKSEAKLEAVMAKVRAKQASKEPWLGEKDYMLSSDYKRDTDGMTQQDIQTVLNVVKDRYESDAKAKEQLYTAFSTGDLKNWPAAKFFNAISKLNDKDAAMMTRKWEAATGPASYNEQMGLTADAIKAFDVDLDKLVDKNGNVIFKRKKDKTFDKEDVALHNKYREKLESLYNDPTKYYNIQERQKLMLQIQQEMIAEDQSKKSAAQKFMEDALGSMKVKDLLNSATGNVFKSGTSMKTISGTTTTAPLQLRQNTPPLDAGTPTDNDGWYAKFREQFGRDPESLEEFINFKKLNK